MWVISFLMAYWCFDRSKKLKDTKDIKKYILGCPTKIRDVEGYANFYSKIFLYNTVFFILFGIVEILDEYYFKMPFKYASIVYFILFVVFIIPSFSLRKKAIQFE